MALDDDQQLFNVVYAETVCEFTGMGVCFQELAQEANGITLLLVLT